ncbi:GtrA family protein [Olsenella sp. HMSC062G07]|uniref:GtrA family protein n=1 Tax=Olsenella sp. HMSC062G07 TaxID=1739330 RepID=UPI000ACDA3E3|nr:GtrA family protein [Olsenella sp. HMSC062G07]
MADVRGIVRQFLKFGVVGLVAFFIDYGILMLLSVGLRWDPVLSAGISFVISLIFNYVASMRYVFTRRDDLSRQGEFVVFVILSLIGLAINELCMWLGTTALGASPLAITATKLIATTIVMVWNFLSRRRWLDAGEAD